MNLKKIYKDIEGENCNILEMVILDQVWAANRIQEGEKAIAKVDEMQNKIKGMEVLLSHVTASEFEGIKCNDVEGHGNWFDLRDIILTPSTNLQE